jgi:hypothetical protein
MSHGLVEGPTGCVRSSLHPTRIKRDCSRSKMVDSSNHYYVVISRRREQPERWSWEIVRKSKPLGVRLTADGFQSETAAQFAGRRALEDFLIQLSKEERRPPK